MAKDSKRTLAIIIIAVIIGVLAFVFRDRINIGEPQSDVGVINEAPAGQIVDGFLSQLVTLTQDPVTIRRSVETDSLEDARTFSTSYETSVSAEELRELYKQYFLFTGWEAEVSEDSGQGDIAMSATRTTDSEKQSVDIVIIRESSTTPTFVQINLEVANP